MAQNKLMSFTVALTTTLTTNLVNCAVTSMSGPVGITIAQPYIIIRAVRILNKTGSAATFSMYIGATGANAAGTEFLGVAQSVAANSIMVFGGLTRRLDSTQFLVGGSGTATALVLEIDYEVGIS